eukprot:4167436-Alexandrium_andersonii.AAC.1
MSWPAAQARRAEATETGQAARARRPWDGALGFESSKQLAHGPPTVWLATGRACSEPAEANRIFLVAPAD